MICFFLNQVGKQLFMLNDYIAAYFTPLLIKTYSILMLVAVNSPLTFPTSAQLFTSAFFLSSLNS